MTRSLSKTLYRSPNASDGLPIANAVMRSVSKSGLKDGGGAKVEGRGLKVGEAGVLCSSVPEPSALSPEHPSHNASTCARDSPDSRTDISVISTIGLPSAYMRASARQ